MRLPPLISERAYWLAPDDFGGCLLMEFWLCPKEEAGDGTREGAPVESSSRTFPSVRAAVEWLREEVAE